MALNNNFIFRSQIPLIPSIILLISLSVSSISISTFGMTIVQPKTEAKLELKRPKNSYGLKSKKRNYLLFLALGYGFGTYHSFRCYSNPLSNGNEFLVPGLTNKSNFIRGHQNISTTVGRAGKEINFIENQNIIWSPYNISIQENHDMPAHYLRQLHHERYLPVKSQQLSDDQGTVGIGANGITFLVIDRMSEELTIAKFTREELKDSEKAKAINHIRQEFKYSKKWQKVTSYGLNVKLQDNVIYKKFIYGKQLSYWLKSKKREIFSDSFHRQKLLEFYENMFNQHKQIMDLQYNNLVFDELKQDWVIIDAGDVLEFSTMEEALEVYLKNYRNKYTHRIRFYGNETKKQEYYDSIDEFAQVVKNYCLEKKEARENKI
ncbi:MAG: hypothetical protein AB8G05_27060 [Oligoflexales bacterium]